MPLEYSIGKREPKASFISVAGRILLGVALAFMVGALLLTRQLYEEWISLKQGPHIEWAGWGLVVVAFAILGFLILTSLSALVALLFTCSRKDRIGILLSIVACALPWVFYFVYRTLQFYGYVLPNIWW